MVGVDLGNDFLNTTPKTEINEKKLREAAGNQFAQKEVNQSKKTTIEMREEGKYL